MRIVGTSSKESSNPGKAQTRTDESSRALEVQFAAAVLAKDRKATAQFVSLYADAGFGHSGILETDTARWVFQKVWPAEKFLDFARIICDDSQRFGTIRQRQEVVEILSSICRPGEVTGNEDRGDAIYESLHSFQMLAIESVGASDRDANRMDRNPVVLRQLRQQFRCVRVRQKSSRGVFRTNR